MRAHRIPAGRRRSAALALAALATGALLFGRASSTLPPGGLPPVAAPFPIDDRGPTPPAPPSAGPRPGQPVMGGPGWRVVSSRSVQGILIVEVETARTLGGRDLAARIIGPARAGHLEALVYFRRPGERLADTRVQWTPASGYVTLALR